MLYGINILWMLLWMLPTLTEVPAVLLNSFVPEGRYFNMLPGGIYQFAYDTGLGSQKSFRFESRDVTGHVKGHYGYVDPDGALRVTEYQADASGYRASTAVFKAIGAAPPGRLLIVGPLPQSPPEEPTMDPPSVPLSTSLRGPDLPPVKMQLQLLIGPIPDRLLPDVLFEPDAEEFSFAEPEMDALHIPEVEKVEDLTLSEVEELTFRSQSNFPEMKKDFSNDLEPDTAESVPDAGSTLFRSVPDSLLRGSFQEVDTTSSAEINFLTYIPNQSPGKVSPTGEFFAGDLLSGILSSASQVFSQINSVENENNLRANINSNGAGNTALRKVRTDLDNELISRIRRKSTRRY